jgi:hypothetical protein
MTNLVVRINGQQRRQSFTDWLEGHSSSLGSVKQCSISERGNTYADERLLLRCLLCPQLCQLFLTGLRLQLEPADGSTGLLHDCRGLAALEVHYCTMQDTRA